MLQDGFELPTIDVGTKAANSNKRANIQAQKQKGAFRLPRHSELDRGRLSVLAFQLSDLCSQAGKLLVSELQLTGQDDGHRVWLFAFHVIRLWSLLDGQT